MMCAMSKHKHQRLSHPPTGPHAVEDLGHAQNPAWWTVMTLGIIAGAVGTWAVVVLSPMLGVVAAVLAVAALLTLGGVVLAGAALFVGRAGGAPRVVLSLGAVLLAPGPLDTGRVVLIAWLVWRSKFA